MYGKCVTWVLCNTSVALSLQSTDTIQFLKKKKKTDKYSVYTFLSHIKADRERAKERKRHKKKQL